MILNSNQTGGNEVLSAYGSRPQPPQMGPSMTPGFPTVAEDADDPNFEDLSIELESKANQSLINH